MKSAVASRMGQIQLEKSARGHAIRAAMMAWLALALLFNVALLRWVNSASLPALVSTMALGCLAAAGCLLAVPLNKIGAFNITSLGAGDVDGRLRNVAEAVALGIGEDVEHVLIHQSEIPNVGAFPTPDGIVVFATTGAVDELSRSELEALVAAQLAGMRDPWCRLATKAELLWNFVKVGGFFFVLVHLWCMVVPMIMLAIPLRSIEATRDLCADVAAVSAAKNPGALASALRHLRPASSVGHVQKLTEWYVPISAFLVLSTRQNPGATVVGEGDNARSYTSADELALELGLRADRAEALAAGGDPSELTGREYRRRHLKLGRAETLNPEEKMKADELQRRHDAMDAQRIPHFIPDDHEIRELSAKIHSRSTEATTGDAARLAWLLLTETPKFKPKKQGLTAVAPQQHWHQPPPGWYTDPAGSTAMRWWDGNNWSEHLRPGQPQQAPVSRH